MDVEEFVDSGDKDSDVVNHGTKEFANRHSFVVMKNRMKANVSRCLETVLCLLGLGGAGLFGAGRGRAAFRRCTPRAHVMRVLQSLPRLQAGQGGLQPCMSGAWVWVAASRGRWMQALCSCHAQLHKWAGWSSHARAWLLTPLAGTLLVCAGRRHARLPGR